MCGFVVGSGLVVVEEGGQGSYFWEGGCGFGIFSWVCSFLC